MADRKGLRPTALFSIKSVPRSHRPNAKSRRQEKRDPMLEWGGHFPSLWNMLFGRQSRPSAAQARAIQSAQSGNAGATGRGGWCELLPLPVQSLKVSTAVGAANELESSPRMFMMGDCVRGQTVYNCKTKVKSPLQCKISTCP